MRLTGTTRERGLSFYWGSYIEKMKAGAAVGHRIERACLRMKSIQRKAELSDDEKDDS